MAGIEILEDGQMEEQENNGNNTAFLSNQGADEFRAWCSLRPWPK
jgi:hypothetical protein